MSTAQPRAIGVRLIVLYKAVKAVLEIALAFTLVALAAAGEIATLREVAIQLKEHLASRWSLSLGRALGALVSERGVHLLELGLALDGVVSAFEGWSLARGYRWGPWLVIFATATPLPLEIHAIVRAPSPSRIALAIVNLAIVLYLARDLRRSGVVGRGAPGTTGGGTSIGA
ncbi:MAG TPA: DUF2127 domain-containing protein [Anaeromyxobacter sp.]|nr:DUF2127 domain-containing protein [Anaeromyxobacter sp.]